MAITSLNQSVNVRYGGQVTSEGVNNKIKEVLGDKAKLEGLDLSYNAGTQCTMGSGKLSIGGVTITESAAIVVDFPGADDVYYLYATYNHGADEECTYEILTATTTAANYLLLATVTVSSSVITQITNEEEASVAKNAVSYSNKKTKAVEQINEVTIGNVVIKGGSHSVDVDNDDEMVTFIGRIRAARVYNPYLSDYAEFFERGMDLFNVGDIVSLDVHSIEESYVRADQENNVVVGVVSDGYAQCIGGDNEGETSIKFVPVGLVGRVPINVNGKVKRGDYIILSKYPGIGRPTKFFWPWLRKRYVGIAVEDKDYPEMGLVRCLVGKI